MPLRVVVKFITKGTAEQFYASEGGTREWLHHEFPESRPFFRLDEVVQAINEFGEAEVEVQPYRPPRAHNLLPPDYQTHVEGEDPWPRAA